MKRIFYLFCLCLFLSYSAYSQSNIKAVYSNNKFSFNLLSKLCTHNDSVNVLFSPISISVAMSMVYDGANGSTAKEIAQVMSFQHGQKDNHKSFINLLVLLQKHEGVLNIANAAFAQEDYKFLKSYLFKLSIYKAMLKKVDFKNTTNREKAILDINNWVAEKTNNKILNILDKNSVDELTRLVVLNAIYFKSNWKQAFQESNTRQLVFTNNNDQYLTSFMNIRESFKIYKNDSIEAIELPYVDDKFSMYIFMPNEKININSFINKFDYWQFVNYITQMSAVRVDLLLPKFKIETKYSLKSILESMGMLIPFSNKANFSKMTGKSDLLIDDVIHQAFIETDEKGTEASAATAVVVREKSSVNRFVPFHVNRPFVYIIRENSTGTILFVGKFLKPEVN